MSYRRNNARWSSTLAAATAAALRAAEGERGRGHRPQGHGGERAPHRGRAARFFNKRTEVIWRSARRSTRASPRLADRAAARPDAARRPRCADLPAKGGKGGKIKIESKEDVVKRLGARPTRATRWSWRGPAGPTYVTDGDAWRAAAEEARPYGTSAAGRHGRASSPSARACCCCGRSRPRTSTRSAPTSPTTARSAPTSPRNLMTSYPVLCRRDLGDQTGMMLRPTRSRGSSSASIGEREDNDTRAGCSGRAKTMRRAMYDPRQPLHQGHEAGRPRLVALRPGVISVRLNRTATPALPVLAPARRRVGRERGRQDRRGSSASGSRARAISNGSSAREGAPAGARCSTRTSRTRSSSACT
jgi:hypothetical protein